MIPEIPASWQKHLVGEKEKPYFEKLENFVADEQAKHTIYPPQEKIFTALDLTSYEDTKVLLLGQDPYIKAGQAHGLCFSVENKSERIPPSLRNIYKELKDDLGVEPPKHANLTAWAKQGILMLTEADKIEEHLDPLLSLLKKHAGACPLRLRLEIDGAEVSVVLRDHSNALVAVNPSEGLCEEVEQLFGKPVLVFS